MQTQVTCGKELIKMIIDGGSCMNVISSTAAEELKLPAELHPQPYHVAWINSSTILVTKCCLVTISYGHYKDSIWYDIVPMYVTRVLLDQPWLYDPDVYHLCEREYLSFCVQV